MRKKIVFLLLSFYSILSCTPIFSTPGNASLRETEKKFKNSRQEKIVLVLLLGCVRRPFLVDLPRLFFWAKSFLTLTGENPDRLGIMLDESGEEKMEPHSPVIPHIPRFFFEESSEYRGQVKNKI